LTFSYKDRIALVVAAVLGASAAYFSSLAGYGWLVVAAPYAILVIPCIVVYVADQRKMLVWQVCILSYALYVLADNWRIRGLGRLEAVKIVLLFWALGTVASSPAPIFFYWQRARIRKSCRLEVFFVGLLFLILLSSLSLDLFVVAGVAIGWIVFWFIESLWRWHQGPNQASRRFALVIGSIFLFVGSISILFVVIFKQRAFAYAVNEGHSSIAVALVTIGADPNATDSNGESALRSAAWNGDATMVQALLSMGAKVDLEEGSEFGGLMPSGTALAVAAVTGRTKICQSLLSAGADVNKKNGHGMTPLLLALARGDIQCVPIILEHGADVNSHDTQGETPLMLLAQFDTDTNDPTIHHVLDELLAKGGDVMAKDVKGQTPEDWALLYHRKELAERLRKIRESRAEK
jgi:hypothetical protein